MRASVIFALLFVTALCERSIADKTEEDELTISENDERRAPRDISSADKHIQDVEPEVETAKEPGFLDIVKEKASRAIRAVKDAYFTINARLVELWNGTSNKVKQEQIIYRVWNKNGYGIIIHDDHRKGILKCAIRQNAQFPLS